MGTVPNRPQGLGLHLNISLRRTDVAMSQEPPNDFEIDSGGYGLRSQ
jgi:hypothetical protein